MLKRSFLLLISLLSVVSLTAQYRYAFTSFHGEGAMFSTTVEKIVQDKNGELWLATQGGLYRFDGIDYSLYTTDSQPGIKQPRPNIVDKWYIGLETDVFSDLWILSHEHSLLRFERNTEKITRALDARIENIFKLSDTDFCFVGEDHTLYRTQYNRASRQCLIKEWFRIPETKTIRGIYKDIDDNLWVFGDFGLYRNQERLQQLPIFCVEENENALLFGTTEGRIIEYIDGQEFTLRSRTTIDIKFIKHLSGGLQYIIGSAEEGLILLDFHNWERTAIEFNGYRSGELKSLGDKLGNIWIWSEKGGINWFDKEHMRLVPFYDPNIHAEWSLDNNIYTSIVDSQNNVWMASSIGGLERAVPNSGNFKLHTFETNTVHASPKNNVRALFYGNNRLLYAATRDGLVHILDEKMQQLAVWNTQHMVYSINSSINGTLWLGTKGGGLIENRYNTINPLDYSPRIYTKGVSAYDFCGEMVYDIDTRDNTKTWIASLDGGLQYLDLSDNSRRFISRQNHIFFPADQQSYMRSVRFGPDGRLYVSGNSGLFVCDDPYEQPENIRFEHFPAVLGFNIHNIMFSSSGELWASTASNGLLRFDSADRNSAVRAYTTNEGLMSNHVLSTIEDKSGNIWVVSTGGLNRLNPENGSIIGYSYERMGIQAHFNEGRPTIDRNGTLYFNTTRGIMMFSPYELTGSSYIPKIILRSCFVSGKRVEAQEGGRIRIDSDDVVLLRFCAVDLSDPERVQYSYKIDGADDDWKTIGNRNSLLLDQLKPGRHTFSLRSTNGDGRSVDNVVSLELRVQRKFSSTTIAALWVLTGVGVSLAIYLGTRRFRRRRTIVHQDEVISEKQLFAQKFREFLEANIDNGELSVGDMAEHMMMSRSALYEKCRNIVEMTPIEYLRDIRFQKAAFLLENSDTPISQIAYNTGFNDSHYFSKSFRNHFGITASEYRKQHRSTKD